MGFGQILERVWAKVVQPIHKEREYWDKVVNDWIETALSDGSLALESAADYYIDNGYASCAIGSLEGVERFFDSPNIQESGGPRDWPPLLYVCFSQINSVPSYHQEFADCARYLLEHGADPDSHFFEPAFPDSPQSALYGAVGVNNNPLLADILLRRGANTQDGESIYHAAQHGHIECLDVLKKHRADFSSTQQPWGNTPLYFLLGYRASDAHWPTALRGVRWLLEEGGADPNVTSSDFEETPLHLAARRHGAEVIELLLAHRAQFDQPTRDGITPYALAARHGNLAALEALRRHGADLPLSAVDQMLAACAVGDSVHAAGLLREDTELMLKLGARDLALLSEHAGEGNLQAVQALCEVGIPLDARGEMGGTALHHAAWRGHLEIVQFLTRLGAPLDARDECNNATPLGWACHGSLFCKQKPGGDYAGVVKTLLEAGSPLPEQDFGSDEVKELIKTAGKG